MTHSSKFVVSLLSCLLAACAQTKTPSEATTPAASNAPEASPATESRDASVAYIGTANFVVGRVGRDCLSLVGRSDSPQLLVATWQKRNAKYWLATHKYLEARLAYAQRIGGLDTRNAVVRELTSATQSGASNVVRQWLDKPDKPSACKKALAFIESGAYDFSPTSPMFAELESLVVWASRQ